MERGSKYNEAKALLIERSPVHDEVMRIIKKAMWQAINKHKPFNLFHFNTLFGYVSSDHNPDRLFYVVNKYQNLNAISKMVGEKIK